MSGVTSMAGAATPSRLVTWSPSRSRHVSSRPYRSRDGQVVVDLQGDGALARAHRAEAEPQRRHAAGRRYRRRPAGHSESGTATVTAGERHMPTGVHVASSTYHLSPTPWP